MEEKINLILEGINLLVISNNNIGEDFRREFNKKFFDINNPQETSIKEETEETLGAEE